MTVPRSLLVFYDGSESSRSGLAFAVRLAATTEAKLTLAHVITPEAGFLDGLPANEREAEGWLNRAVKQAGGHQSDHVERLVLEANKPAETIVALSEERDADLTVVGRSGAGGVRRYMIGSCAERLIEHAPSSVAVFPPESASHPLLNVVVGYDGSAYAIEALSQGEALASALALPLQVIHVVKLQLPYPTDIGLESYGSLLRRHGQELLEEAQAQVDKVDGVALRDGDPRHSLVELAKEQPGALIVLGYRGVGGFIGLRLGSTSWELARRSTGPVLIAKSRPAER